VRVNLTRDLWVLTVPTEGVMSDRRGNVEIRKNKDGTVDELLIYDKDGQCIFHMEQMDTHWHWARVYGTEEDCVLQISATIGEVPGQLLTDENGRVLYDEEKKPRFGEPGTGPKIVVDYQWEEKMD